MMAQRSGGIRVFRNTSQPRLGRVFDSTQRLRALSYWLLRWPNRLLLAELEELQREEPLLEEALLEEALLEEALLE